MQADVSPTVRWAASSRYNDVLKHESNENRLVAVREANRFSIFWTDLGYNLSEEEPCDVMYGDKKDTSAQNELDGSGGYMFLYACS